MTAVIFDLHTNTNGTRWWGSATHPAHLDENSQLISGSEWDFRVSDKLALVEAYHDLLGKVYIAKSPLFKKLHPEKVKSASCGCQ